MCDILRPYYRYLKNGFKFSKNFTDYVKNEDLEDIKPWEFFCKSEEDINAWSKSVKKLYSSRNLVPFAHWVCSDDIACFDGDDLSGNPKVYYVHAFASPGCEDRGSVKNFDEWLEIAKKQSLEWQSEEN